ncbi:MAG: hypothetical protein R2810_03670 [Flavobacteriales bacterium]
MRVGHRGGDVTQPPPPVAMIDGVLTFCAGGSTCSTATGGTNFLWNTGDTTGQHHGDRCRHLQRDRVGRLRHGRRAGGVVIEATDARPSRTPPSGTAPLTVFFTASAGAGGRLVWDFGQGPQPGPDARSIPVPCAGQLPRGGERHQHQRLHQRPDAGG